MWKDLKIPFFTVLFIFLGFFLFTKLFGPLPFSVTSLTTTKTDLFTVDGTGQVTAIPDTAILTLGVNKTGSTVASAKNQVDTIINKISDDMKHLGVASKNIQTTDYSIDPQYDYSNGQQTLKGYTVNAQITIKVSPIDKANNAIDIATSDGATNVGSVQFVVNDTKEKDLENQARQQAIANAKQKAEAISRAAGINLGHIVNVQENTQMAPQPLPVMNTALKADAAAQPSTRLNPGENKISISVTLSYETY